jgi:hypothetical protein
MKQLIKLNLALFVLFALLAFPLFYFVYKYSSPYVGMIDFFDYYKLYKNMDYHAADSPLNMRLVSSFFIYCMSRCGLFYDTMTQIDNAPFDKVIYFNAVFFNYLSVAATCVMIFHLARQRDQSVLMSFLAGILYLLGFGTIFFQLMPLADAFSVLLLTAILWYYHRKSYLIIIPLVILIFQREYIFLAFGLIAFADYLKYRLRYYLVSLVVCILCFATYVIVRKLYFETERYSHHTNVEFMLGSLSTLHFPLIPFIKQTLMTMNICLIYFLVVLYKRYKRLEINRYELLKVGLLILQVLILSFLLALGNNAGRYFYLFVPIIILNLIEEVRAFRLGEITKK